MRPARDAAVLSLAYLALAAAWLAASGEWAAARAGTPEELAALELRKGLAFVAVSAALLFVVTWRLLLRLQRRLVELAAHRDALVRAERHATAGLMASALAHDCRNLLQVVRFSADDLAALAAPGGETPEARRLEGAVDRLVGIATRLVDAGRSRLDEPREGVDLHALTAREVDVLRRHPRLRDCRIEVHGAPPVPARVYPTRVAQIVTNLLLNAGEATAGRGRIEIRLDRASDPACAVLEVHDDGHGVPPDRRDAIFKAYASDKAGGTGLGLLSVRAAARAHGGEVTVATSPLGGACFRVTLCDPPDVPRDVDLFGGFLERGEPWWRPAGPRPGGEAPRAPEV